MLVDKFIEEYGTLDFGWFIDRVIYDDIHTIEIDGNTLCCYLENGDLVIKAEFIQHEGKIKMHGVLTYRDGKHIERYDYGMLHSETHPAIFIRDDEGGGEYWYYKDKHHRVDGPAIIEYLPDGSLQREEWWQDDKKHRIGGPAVISYVDRIVTKEEWWIDGKKQSVEF